MPQLLLTVIFIAIWLPAVVFTAGNQSTTPPIHQTYTLKGPFHWRYEKRDIVMFNSRPEFLLYGSANTKNGPKPAILRAGVLEWSLSGIRDHKKKRIYHTGRDEMPFVSEWGLEHDAGLTYRIGNFRFNLIFIFAIFFSLTLPILFILLLISDKVSIESPEVRKQRNLDFVSLVKSIESRAGSDPKWLKRKTLTLAVLGCLVVVGSIFLMVPVGIGILASAFVLAGFTGSNVLGAKIAFLLALIPIGFAWHLGKSLLMPGYRYSGIEMKRKECPALFAYLDKIRRKTKGPNFSRVFIDSNLNASVSRNGGLLGFFGMGPVVLTLGLPLMQSLNHKQLAGVIGHEYGHVAAKDNALGQWIYRIRNSWLVLGERLRFDPLWYALRLNRFYDWFIAAFSAHSFALSRYCEYEADAFSARMVGKEAMAESLSAIAVYGNQFDSVFWRKIWDKSHHEDDIQAVRPYADVPQFFASVENVSETAEFALKEKTNYSATHPAISDRLAALSAPFKAPQAPAESAATRLLGAMEAKLICRFNDEWQIEAQENWQVSHNEFRSWSEKYQELREKAIQDLNDTELDELITAANRLNDYALFNGANRELLRRYPENSSAAINCFWYRLIIEKDESQLADIEKWMEKFPEYLPNLCRYAIEFYNDTGREQEAEPFHERLENWEYLRNSAQEERSLILESDEFIPHGLAPDIVADFVGYFDRHPVIAKVYLVQKSVKYMPEYPCYVIAYRTKPKFWQTQAKVDEQVSLFIDNSGLSQDYMFISADSVKGLESKLKKVEGSDVYRRK